MQSAKLKYLRDTHGARALQWKGPPRGFTDPPKSDHTAVRVTGGIGDLIMALGVGEALNCVVGDVKIYSKYPEIARMFSALPAVHEKELMENGLDWYISLNCLAFFVFSNNFDGFKNPKVTDLLVAHKKFVSSGVNWQYFIENHPHLDSALAREAVKQGLTRESTAYEFLGVGYLRQNRHPGYFNEMNRGLCSKFPFPYITVHDGFDTNHTEITGRATKTWDLQHWKFFVDAHRSAFPGHRVVQIGGPTSRRIANVDYDFVGALSFAESMEILNRSACHVDGDSGLVHAAHAMNVRSVVLFGPTNSDFFGYKENINIKAPYCGDCWWLNPDWVGKCALDFAVPECMDSINPREVQGRVGRVILGL